MKKTTKFLLVLAAVVAMTIGAVSTVMAADDVVIGAWAGDEKNGYTATDVNGNQIRRGWAVDGTTGIWYYFVNSKMATNRFVTTGGKTYFVNAEGAMHTGWMEFKKDVKVNVNGAQYDNVAAAFGKTTIGESDGVPFADKTRYATLWCYFDENGVLAKSSSSNNADGWTQVDGIWYYMDGPFCLIDEWSFTVIIDAKKGTTAKYGFDKSGAMYSGWIAYVKKETTNTDATNSGTPWEKPGSSTTTETVSWVYYAPNGQLYTKNGWLKDSNGDWFFMQMNAEINVPTAVVDTYIISKADGFNVYLDKSGYMMMDDTLTVAGGSKGKEIKVMVAEDAKYILTAGENIKVAKNETVVLTFNETGALVTGIAGLSYFENGAGSKYEVNAAVATSGAIAVTTKAISNKMEGIQWSESFLYVWTDSKGNTKVNYFVDGEMVKLAALPFGDKVLAFDKDGNIISDAKGTTIDGVVYLPSAEELIPGVPFAVIKK